MKIKGGEKKNEKNWKFLKIYPTRPIGYYRLLGTENQPGGIGKVEKFDNLLFKRSIFGEVDARTENKNLFSQRRRIMKTRFKATHRIEIINWDGTEESIPVMLFEDCLYQACELGAEGACDWYFADNGEIVFQGRVPVCKAYWLQQLPQLGRHQ